VEYLGHAGGRESRPERCGIADFSLDGVKPCRQITRHLE
jgi:hypothetical protein